MKFSQLELNKNIQKAISQEGYTEATPIQEQAIPELLKGNDVIGVAQTGTGKSAAFILPVLQKLSEHSSPAQPKHPRVLILAPTRELAAQIQDSAKTYGRYTHSKSTAIFGGVNQRPQVKALQNGVDIVVATPGRLLDLLQQKKLFLDKVETFVLDEADRMLDMGFVKDIRQIKPQLQSKHQSLLFSATMSKQVSKLAKELLHNPVRVEVATEGKAADHVDQKLFYVDSGDKFNLLIHLLEQGLEHVLIFTRTKRKADKLSQQLKKKNYKAKPIHGDKSQNQRTKALKQFSDNKLILVATDVAARGIDVEGITHVINYELPNDAENYVHRIGRTGRAGNEGDAYSFCDEREKDFLKSIEKVLGEPIPVYEHKFHSEKARTSTQSAPGRGGRRRGSRNKKKRNNNSWYSKKKKGRKNRN
jgi:ATP-dependent RNA helicase RhlE